MRKETNRRKSHRAEEGHWVLWLDKRGRMTLPKALLHECGWEVGDTLRFEVITELPGCQSLRVSNQDAEARQASRDALAFRAIVAMTEALELGLEERSKLLDVPPSTFLRWEEHGLETSASDGLRERMGILLGIYHLAGTAFPGGDGAKGWIYRPNTHPLFGGRPPLDLLLGGDPSALNAMLALLKSADALWS